MFCLNVCLCACIGAPGNWVTGSWSCQVGARNRTWVLKTVSAPNSLLTETVPTVPPSRFLRQGLSLKVAKLVGPMISSRNLPDPQHCHYRYGCWESKLGFPCLYKKHFTHLAICPTCTFLWDNFFFFHSSLFFSFVSFHRVSCSPDSTLYLSETGLEPNLFLPPIPHPIVHIFNLCLAESMGFIVLVHSAVCTQLLY